ncbi:MAG TPA: glutathione S-transferase N-terminal domain-containing protein [Gammaproteobacteria bacterium]|nr:glutathione S-transferase N-terminal domain-containing protein [Gammaproteobacteria bacterium]
MATPVLYIFAISHYCEKARWALDYLNIEYRLQHLSPVSYGKFVRSLGVADTSLPVLVTNSLVLQGSASIIDWAMKRGKSSTRSLGTDIDNTGREIERRLDEVFGVHVRRYYYAEAMFDQPQAVRRIFATDLRWPQKIVLRLAWSKICKYMIRGMDLGVAQGLESRQIIETELDWLDGLLDRDQPFLCGEQFSRTDLTAASLLSPLALPAQHPAYQDLQIPPGVAADLADWRERPSLRWVRDIYRQYR